MYEGKIGFRIFVNEKIWDSSVVSELAKIPIPNIADAMGRFRVMDPGIQQRIPEVRLAGTAVTVMVRPGDNLMVHKAMEMARPGDIIVVNTCGNTTSAVWGELMTASALAAGIAGLVVDGAVRDTQEIKKQGFPVFSRSLSASGCDKDGPGEINCPISCGSLVVMPGDIILGSHDGIVVVPPEDAKEVLQKAISIQNREEKRISEIESGKIFKPEINEKLKEQGVIKNG